MMNIKASISDLIYLFYPEYCICCQKNLYAKGHKFCTSCLSDLPETDHFTNLKNELYLRFLGRQELSFASALFNMYPKGKIHGLVYDIKYKGKKNTAQILGQMYGRKLVEYGLDQQVDFIVPVPIHKYKLRRRGFNQSLEYAKGIEEITKIPILNNLIFKTKNSQSITHNNRTERISAVMDSFELNTKIDLQNKHLLFVDDVITTGATLDACMTKIKENNDIKSSIGIIAITKH